MKTMVTTMSPGISRLRKLILAVGSIATGGLAVNAQTPAEALDVPTWQLTMPAETGTTTPRMRVVTGDQASDGADALAGDRGGGQGVVVSTIVEGPGEFSWWWKVNGLTGADRLSFGAESTSGLPIHSASGHFPSITGSTEWISERFTLPAGRIVLTWTQQRSTLLLPGRNAAWLDRFSFTPAGAAVSVAEALDNSSLVWTVEGDALWRGIRSGADAAAPDYAFFGSRLPANSPPSLRLRSILPAGWFSFRIRGHASITVPQGTRFYNEQTMSDGWKIVSGRLPATAELVLQPQWFTFGSLPEFALDDFVTRPDVVSATEALDAPGAVWTFGPSESAWRLSPLPNDSFDGADAAVFNGPISGGGSTGWIDGTFTGPAEIRARVRHNVSGSIKVTLGNLTLENISLNAPTGEWREQRFLIPAGVSTLRWEGDFALDDVRVMSLPVLSGEQAADTAALTWTGLNAPPGGWYALADAEGSYDGADLLRSGPGSVVRPATATWNGAGTVRFRWRNSVSLNFDAFSSLLSNTSAAWSPVHLEVPGGSHAAEFIAAPGTDPAEMDDFSRQADAWPWRTALESRGEFWTGSGDALWEVTTEGAHTGPTALASPELRAGQTSRVVLRLTGPAVVKFWWRGAPDSPARNASGQVKVGSVPACRITTATAWHEETLNIDSGPQTVEWSATPLTEEGCAADALQLDDVRVYHDGTPVATELTAAAGLPAQLFVFSGAAKLHKAPASEAHDGVDALRLEPSAFLGGGTEVSRLDTSVSGPFELSFWWRMTVPSTVDLYVDGTLWMSLAPRSPFAGSGPHWNRGIVSIGSAGTHQLSFRTAWSSFPSGAFWLDDMQFSSPNAAGTFSASAGGAPVEWAIPNLGEDHFVPDTVILHNGTSGVRLGAGAASFKCRLTGPATLSGWWRHEMQGGFAAISAVSPGAIADRLNARAVWQPFRVVFDTAGPQWLTFLASTASGQDPESLWLNSMTVEAGRPATIGEALASPNLSWIATPAGSWKTLLTPITRRVFYDAPLTVPAPEIKVQVTGPGFVIADASPALSFDLDGVAGAAANWVAVPAGEHTVRWRVLESVPPGTAFLNGMARILAASASGVDAATDLDETDGVALTGAPAGLSAVADSVLPSDGVDMAVSPPLLSANTPAVITFSAAGPGRFFFAAAAAAADVRISTLLDSAVVTADSPVIAGSQWVWHTVSVPPGTHEVGISASRLLSTGPVPFLLLDRVRLDSDESSISVAGNGLDAGTLTWRERAAQPFTEQPPPLEGASTTGDTIALSPFIAPGDYAWLETTLTGPGIVSFRPGIWNSNGVAAAGVVEASWDATTVTLGPGSTRFRIPDTGPVNFRITFRNAAGNPNAAGVWRRYSVDSFNFVPDSDPGISLAEALDAPAVTWTSTPAQWRGIEFGGHGDMAVTSGDMPAGTRTLGLTLPRPGRLSWRWRRDGSSAGGMTLTDLHSGRNLQTFSIFGGLMDDWATLSDKFFLPQQMRLEFRASGLAPRDMVQIDNVQWIPAPEVSIGEALDSKGHTWTTSDPSAWYALEAPSQSRDGRDVLISGPLEHGQSAWVETVVNPPAYVSFEWKVSSDPNDRLTLSINGTPTENIGGTSVTNYVSREMRLTDINPVTLRWTYSKNASLTEGEDTAWLDKVVIAESDSRIITAANVSGLTLTTGGNAGYSFLALDTPLALTGGACAAFFGSSPLQNPPPSREAWLDTTVNGPGIFSSAWRGPFELLVNGAPAPIGSPDTWLTSEQDSWKRVWREFTGAGPWQIRIRCTAPGTFGDPSMVDEIRFDPAMPLEAANTPGIAWTTGSPPWFSFGAGDRQMAGAPQLGNGESSWAQAAMTGPGLFGFSAFGRGVLSLDGIALHSINSVSNSGNGPYSSKVFVPPGQHTLRWSCSSSDRLWLTGFSFAPPSTPWLPSLLDADGLWMMTASPGSHSSGIDVPLGPDNEFAAWSTTSTPVDVLLPAAGHLEVDWSRTAFVGMFNTTSELTFTPGSNASCAAPDEWVTAASGSLNTPGLVRVSLTPPAGAPPDMLMRTDRLRFIPRTSLTIAEAADTEDLTVTENTGWTAMADQTQSYDGLDFLVTEMNPLRQQASLTATVNGPLSLSFRWRATTINGITMSVDGAAFSTKASNAGWKCMRLDLAPGSHVLRWTATGSTSGDRAMLDTFTATVPSTFHEVFGPHVPAVFSSCDAFAIVNAGGRPGIVPVSVGSMEALVPGPSLLGPDFTTGTFLTHTGLMAKSVVLPSTPDVPPLISYPLTLFSPVGLQEALDWPNPVTTSGGWAGLTAGAGTPDFAWIKQTAGNSPQWIETTVAGPGKLSWTAGSLAWGDVIITVDGSAINSSEHPWSSWSFPEAREYTVRWTVRPPNAGDRLFTFESLVWAPYTPENNFAAWTGSLGLTGAAAAASADPDGDSRNNLIEFALGTNAALADGGRSPSVVIVPRDGYDVAGIEFTCREIPGLFYELQEYSTNLFPARWLSSAIVSKELLSESGTLVRCRYIRESKPVTGQPTLLLRLSISYDP